MFKKIISSVFLVSFSGVQANPLVHDAVEAYVGPVAQLNRLDGIEAYAAGIKAGIGLADFIILEARILTGLQDGKEVISGTNVDSHLDALVGLHVKSNFDVGPVNAFGLLGAVYQSFDLNHVASSSDAQKLNENLNFSYGGGVEYDLSDHWGLGAEYLYQGKGSDSLGVFATLKF